jgi:pimeloyl-ACP methyl ester carboxylesterase
MNGDALGQRFDPDAIVGSGPAFEQLGDWLDAAWAIPACVRHVEIEGAEIACRIWGHGNDSERSILFVHGFRANARWWDHIAPHFADRFRVVALDLSGMGDSGRRQHYSRALFAHELLGIIEQLNLHRPTVIAHSFGTLVALYAAALVPDAIGRLILIDGYPTGFPRLPDARERFYPDRGSILSRYRLDPPGRWPDPRVTAYLANASIRETVQGWTWKFDPNATETLKLDVPRQDVGHIVQPVDAIFADLTEIVPHDRISNIAKWLPTCGRPIKIHGCHHHVMIEQPQALVAVLSAPLSR